MSIFEIAEALAGHNMGSFGNVLHNLHVGFVMGVLEGAGYYSYAPTVLVHSNEPHGDWICFTVIHGSESTTGSLKDSYTPLPKR